MKSYGKLARSNDAGSYVRPLEVVNGFGIPNPTADAMTFAAGGCRGTSGSNAQYKAGCVAHAGPSSYYRASLTGMDGEQHMALEPKIVHDGVPPPPPDLARGVSSGVFAWELSLGRTRTPGAAPRPRIPSGAMIRRFLRFERGGVALESAIALSVLVIAFASLMNIVGDVYAEDRTSRGARAVAHALALDPAADPWAALGHEIDIGNTCPDWTAADTTADCGGLKLTIHLGVSPATLDAALGAGATTAGEMVLVRLERTASAGTVALGLARSEPRS